jgi:glycerophosphoryl diester phosphodiesterase
MEGRSPVSKALRIPAAIVVAVSLAFSLAAVASAKTVTSAGLPVVNTAGQTFKVLAHRGGAAQWPENSLEAFTGAAEAGYDGIETDMAFTLDGIAVMSHYDKLPSRCDQRTRIHEMTWEQVQTVRCADRTGAMTVPIPSFLQLAEVLAAHPGVALNLDIKTYTGQSSAEMRLYAYRAVMRVKDAGLLDRTRFLSFNWSVALPTIRKLAPSAYVLAYDHNGFDYDRVRLAAKLGASGYGTEARYTSVNLSDYIRSRGMEMVPWNITTTQGQAMAIFSGPKTYWFMTDSPSSMTAKLTGGTGHLNWTAADVVTTLTKPVTVSKATYKANRDYYPRVLGNAVPSSKLAALKTVNISVTLTKGSAKNYLYAAARSSDSSSRIKVALAQGTSTVWLSVPVGDDGKLRIRTSKKTKLTIQVLSYTNTVFTEVPPATTPVG